MTDDRIEVVYRSRRAQREWSPWSESYTPLSAWLVEAFKGGHAPMKVTVQYGDGDRQQWKLVKP